MELEPILFEKMGFDSTTLKGDRALVTGAAKGIGRQTALALAFLGARVAIVDRDLEMAEETAEQIRQMGGEVLVVHADIAAEGQLVGAIEEVCSQWQGVDILVNNAAEAFIGSFVQETQEVWDRVFDTNLRYPAAAIKAVLPNMLDGGRGVIANVISIEGLPFSSAYSATKVGMRSLTASIAAEIGSDSGVWLFSFAPGIVDTPLVNDYFYTELASRFGMTMQDVIAGVGGNPGYPGLMPAAHCAAGLVNCIQSARSYHGQVVNPFLSLAKAGIISFDDGLQTQPTQEAEEGEGALPKELASLGDYLKSVTELNRALEHRVDVRTQELTEANEKLKSLLEEVNQLSGLLPICSFCKKIRDDKGYWTQLETYLDDHSEAQFSHGVCEECIKEHYSDL